MNNQFLTFKLDKVRYAIEVYQVQEVLEYIKPTKVPCVATYMEGLISSRGQGISVVNLRVKFGMDAVEVGDETRIVVVEIKHNEETITFGAVADSVQEVIDLDVGDVETPPGFGNTISPEFVSGIGRKDNEFVILLDINKIFSGEEFDALGKASNN